MAALGDERSVQQQPCDLAGDWLHQAGLICWRAVRCSSSEEAGTDAHRLWTREPIQSPRVENNPVTEQYSGSHGVWLCGSGGVLSSWLLHEFLK